MKKLRSQSHRPQKTNNSDNSNRAPNSNRMSDTSRALDANSVSQISHGRNKGKSQVKKSGRSQKELENFKLGESQTEYGFNYSPDLLEAFDNKNPGKIAWTTFICTEFTSLCPKTGQPDFAKIYINYIADKKMVESKSLKLYLFSFRNHGDFHEDCIQTICNDLAKLMNPKYIEVVGEFTPRGGIAIFPFASASNSEKSFQKIRDERLINYSPGKYTCDLSKVY